MERYAKFGESAGELLSPAEVDDYRVARSMLPAGVLLREAARAYVKHHRPDTPDLVDAIASYETSMKAAKLSAS